MCIKAYFSLFFGIIRCMTKLYKSVKNMTLSMKKWTLLRKKKWYLYMYRYDFDWLRVLVLLNFQVPHDQNLEKNKEN